jgi:hypothetical protein
MTQESKTNALRARRMTNDAKQSEDRFSNQAYRHWSLVIRPVSEGNSTW